MYAIRSYYGPDLDRKLAAEEYRLPSGLTFNSAHRPGMIRIMRNGAIRTIRITSYNVCYTKLLRASCSILLRLMYLSISLFFWM